MPSNSHPTVGEHFTLLVPSPDTNISPIKSPVAGERKDNGGCFSFFCAAYLFYLNF
jgi:hypothetical protein